MSVNKNAERVLNDGLQNIKISIQCEWMTYLPYKACII